MVTNLVMVNSPPPTLNTVLVHDGPFHLNRLAPINQLDLSLAQNGSPCQIDHLVIRFLTFLVLISQELHGSHLKVIIVFGKDACTVLHLVKSAERLEHLVDQGVILFNLRVRHVDKLAVRGLAGVVGYGTSPAHVKLVQLILTHLVRIHVMHVDLVHGRCLRLHPREGRLLLRRWVPPVFLRPFPIPLLLLNPPFFFNSVAFLFQRRGILGLLEHHHLNLFHKRIILVFLILRHRLLTLISSQSDHE